MFISAFKALTNIFKTQYNTVQLKQDLEIKFTDKNLLLFVRNELDFK